MMIRTAMESQDTFPQEDSDGQDTDSSRQQQMRLPSWFVVQLTATASLGGCLFGYDMGAISGTLSQLAITFDLSDNQKELVVSILYVGGALGACIGGSLCDKIGRKVTIILTDLVFMFGALLLYLASSYTAVVVGRFVVGVGVAVSGVADVTYLRECAPIEWRGSIVSVNEACISLGFLLAYIAGYIFADEDAEEWRIVFGVAGILAGIQLLGMIKLPESPAWLTEKGYPEAAARALRMINGEGDEIGSRSDRGFWLSMGWNSEAYDETRRTRARVDSRSPLRDHTVEEEREETLPTGASNTFSDDKDREDTFSDEYFVSEAIRDDNTNFSAWSWYHKVERKLYGARLMLSRYRAQICIAAFLAIAQQFCGQTNILSYAPLIVSEAMKNDFDYDGDDGADFNDAESKDMSMVIIGVVKFFVTVLVIWRIEYIGRRSLLIFGNVMIALGLLALVIAFGGSNSSVDNNTAASWSPMTNIKTFNLALPGVLLVVSGYSISFGPLTWLLTSEIFPTEIRGRALGYSSIITSICGAISTQTFLLAQSILGPSFVFGIYCVITIAGALFAYLAIPETGGKTVEQIDESLNQLYWWKYSSMSVSQDDEDCMHGGPLTGSRSEMVRTSSLSQVSEVDIT